MTYETAKFIHLLGVTMLIGNVTATAIWKFFADRSDDAKIVGFAQRLITLTDWSLTCWGVLLTVIGGYGAASIGHLDIFTDRWLIVGQMLFLASGVRLLCLLVPLQVAMARQARESWSQGSVTSAYRSSSRLWLIFRVSTTMPLVLLFGSW